MNEKLPMSLSTAFTQCSRQLTAHNSQLTTHHPPPTTTFQTAMHFRVDNIS